MSLISSIKTTLRNWILDYGSTSAPHFGSNRLQAPRDAKPLFVIPASNGYIIQVIDNSKEDVSYHVVPEGENLAEAINVAMMRVKLGG